MYKFIRHSNIWDTDCKTQCLVKKLINKLIKTYCRTQNFNLGFVDLEDAKCGFIESLTYNSISGIDIENLYGEARI